jgi:transposase-like protein
MIKEFASLYEMFAAFPDEQSCLDHFRAIRWKNGEFCPYCGHDRVYHFADRRNFKCGQCRQRFSIKVGTIFEDSKIPLRKWFAAIWLITAHKKGIASMQLARDIHVTQKTAWFMLQRLRFAARTRSFNRLLKGRIEADESFFGGREKNKHFRKRDPKAGGGRGKVVVFGALERGGELRTKKVERVADVMAEVRDNVQHGSVLMTDDHSVYRFIGRHFKHLVVRHAAGEYARGRTHTNTLEGVWGLFKRQIYGIHHWVSPKHLHRYLSEMTWRYNRRGLDDGARMNEFLTRMNGRLTYKALIE